MNMKKALKHDVEVAGKTIPTMILVGLFLVGGGSAALLTSFGTVEGTANVDNQAIEIQGDQGSSDDNKVSFGFDGSGTVPPETVNKQVTLVNNNPSESIGFTWEVTEKEGGSGSELSYVNTGVYRTSNYNLYNVVYGEKLSGVSEAEKLSADVKVTPSVDTVTYSIPFPSEANWVNLEVSRQDGSEYQIGYDGSSFYYVDPSEPGTSSASDLQNFDPYVSSEVKDGRVYITVKRPKGYSQSFGVHLDGNFDDDSSTDDTAFTKNVVKYDLNTFNTEGSIEGALYAPDNSGEHETPTVTSVVGQEVSLSGGATQTYNVATEFTVQTGAGSYTVTANAVP